MVGPEISDSSCWLPKYDACQSYRRKRDGLILLTKNPKRKKTNRNIILRSSRARLRKGTFHHKCMSHSAVLLWRHNFTRNTWERWLLHSPSWNICFNTLYINCRSRAEETKTHGKSGGCKASSSQRKKRKGYLQIYYSPFSMQTHPV